jgi:hypothetical protein
MSKKLEPIGQAKVLPIPQQKQVNQTKSIAELPIEQFSPPEYYCRAGNGLDDYLAKSIERYGQLIPILVNQNIDRLNVIIDGVARWETISALGYKTIRVNYTDVPKELEKDVHITSNIQCKEFYEDFIREVNGPFTDMLMEYFAEKDKEIKPIKNTSAEPVSASLTGGDEIKPLHIHLPLKDANWIKCMRKVLKKENQSQVFQFLIKYFIENEKN